MGGSSSSSKQYDQRETTTTNLNLQGLEDNASATSVSGNKGTVKIERADTRVLEKAMDSANANYQTVNASFQDVLDFGETAMGGVFKFAEQSQTSVDNAAKTYSAGLERAWQAAKQPDKALAEGTFKTLASTVTLVAGIGGVAYILKKRGK